MSEEDRKYCYDELNYVWKILSLYSDSKNLADRVFNVMTILSGKSVEE